MSGVRRVKRPEDGSSCAEFVPVSNEDIISGPARLIEAGRSSCLSRDTLFLNGGRDRTAQQPGPKEYRSAGDGEDLATLGELAKYFQQRRCHRVSWATGSGGMPRLRRDRKSTRLNSSH